MVIFQGLVSYSRETAFETFPRVSDWEVSGRVKFLFMIPSSQQIDSSIGNVIRLLICDSPFCDTSRRVFFPVCRNIPFSLTVFLMGFLDKIDVIINLNILKHIIIEIMLMFLNNMEFGF